MLFLKVFDSYNEILETYNNYIIVRVCMPFDIHGFPIAQWLSRKQGPISNPTFFFLNFFHFFFFTLIPVEKKMTTFSDFLYS